VGAYRRDCIAPAFFFFFWSHRHFSLFRFCCLLSLYVKDDFPIDDLSRTLLIELKILLPGGVIREASKKKDDLEV